jgi:hypothetical protein
LLILSWSALVFGLERDVDDGLGELELLEHDRGLDGAEGVAGLGVS